MSHVTRTPLSRLKGQRSRSPGRFTHRRVGASSSCSGGCGNVLAVRNCCYVAVCSAARGASAPTGEERGGGISWRPPAYSLFVTESTRERAYLQQRLRNTNMTIVPRLTRREISLRYINSSRIHARRPVENFAAVRHCLHRASVRSEKLESFNFIDCIFWYIHCFVHLIKFVYVELFVTTINETVLRTMEHEHAFQSYSIKVA